MSCLWRWDQAAYRLPKGHRLRVALSASYWPYCWPEGEDVATLTLSRVVRLIGRMARSRRIPEPCALRSALNEMAQNGKFRDAETGAGRAEGSGTKSPETGRIECWKSTEDHGRQTRPRDRAHYRKHCD